MAKRNKWVYHLKTPNIEHDIPLDRITELLPYSDGEFTIQYQDGRVLVSDPMYAGLIYSAHCVIAHKLASASWGCKQSPNEPQVRVTYYREDSWRTPTRIARRKKTPFLIRSIKK